VGLSKKINVGVLFGGRSAEHEVSLVSARSIISALDDSKYNVVPIGISKGGRWLVGDLAMESLKRGEVNPHLSVYFPPDPTVKRLLPFNEEMDIPDIKPYLGSLDVIFPVLHGPFGEDGTIQGLLELADIAYVGAGVLGSSVSIDKIVQKQICGQAGLPIVKYLWFKARDWLKNSTHDDVPLLINQLANMPRGQMIEIIVEQLDLPVFVKPANLGSSVGISKVKTEDDLYSAIEIALRYARKVIIEKAVPHAREIEVAVLGNEAPQSSLAGEVIPSNEFYDYNAKYIDGASTLEIPAKLPEEIHEGIQLTAIKAVLAVEAEGMARVDLLLDDENNQFYLNEVNTIPGFTKISMYPKLWQASGKSYPTLLDELIQLAIQRHDQKSALQTTFVPEAEWYK
jgi:D-alanine-D-alanine ligase